MYGGKVSWTHQNEGRLLAACLKEVGACILIFKLALSHSELLGS